MSVAQMVLITTHLNTWLNDTLNNTPEYIAQMIQEYALQTKGTKVLKTLT